MLFLLFLISFFGCQKEATVPPHLIGVWEASGIRYTDRYIRITEGSLIFGIGKGQEVSHSIIKIKTEKQDGETVYTFHYKDREGVKWTLSLLYYPDSGGTIQVQNREEVWKKVEPGGT